MSPFMTYFLFLFFALAAVVSAAPLIPRDDFVPPILYPQAGTVWTVGQKHNVTWSLNNVPSQITNPNGKLVLAKGGYLIGLDKPIAQNFSIALGRIEITVPDVQEPGNDYALVLFGNSGNSSPNFTINK
ncbi:hypothetical protein BDW22DRAFT_1362343 [Trametopsis cervina]|nr:hypothetical protein BDW22DRAFT_1362343 [Trametopsis cervina]